VDKDKLAKRIAREIFLVGDEYGEKVHRIQFMLGNVQTERAGGGLGEGPLESVIRRVLHTADGGTENG
jgi:hypothetical protein